MEPVASSAIMVNNIAVSLRAMVGGIAMYMPEVPLITPPGAFTVFHSVCERSYDWICRSVGGPGQYGLRSLGFCISPWGFGAARNFYGRRGRANSGQGGILLPGRYHRRDALKIYGIQAAKLLFGIIPLLVIAGMIEGFFSPQVWIPNAAKYLAGSAIFVRSGAILPESAS